MAMGASKVTCLSEDDHDSNIKDYMLHYSGCIEISKQKKFFNANDSFWQQEIKHQVSLSQKPGGNMDEARIAAEGKRIS
ncbi:hypothetical protein F4819DRAFT_468694 [Hypoxylon fuscum]|nr:hypothetical protein F4819DRAFT_468694 [Hypoxylon fuscum]